MKEQDTPERLLRALLTRTHLRAELASRGHDRTLDHLAQGGRRTEPHRLLGELEVEVRRTIARECGEAWAGWFEGGWNGFNLLRNRGVTDVQHASGEPLPFEWNWLGGLFDAAFRFRPALDAKAFLECPFRAWVTAVTHGSKLGPAIVRSRLCGHDPDRDRFAPDRQGLAVSDRTFERWLAGERIGRLPGGYRAFTLAALALPDVDEHRSVVDRLAGWLLITVGMQSMSVSDRRRLASSSPFMGLAPPPQARLSRPEIDRGCRFVDAVVLPYQEGELDIEALGRALDEWRDVAEANPMTRVPYGRLRARLAEERGEDARALYEAVADESASNGVYDREHHACLLEALAYGRRSGRPVDFRHFWDRARRAAVFGLDTPRTPSPDQSDYIDRIVELGPRCLRLVVVHEIA